MKKVTMTLFDNEGIFFHSYLAQVIEEDEETIVINMPLRNGSCHQTHSKQSGLFLRGFYDHLPKHVMMAAEKPIKDSFAHISEIRKKEQNESTKKN